MELLNLTLQKPRVSDTLQNQRAGDKGQTRGRLGCGDWTIPLFQLFTKDTAFCFGEWG